MGANNSRANANIEDIVNPHRNSTAQQVWGLRKPGTNLGRWDGAIVLIQFTNDQCMIGLFENGMDYISDCKVDHSVLKGQYDKYQREGWQPMTKEDIRKTAGLKDSDLSNYNPNVSM